MAGIKNLSQFWDVPIEAYYDLYEVELTNKKFFNIEMSLFRVPIGAIKIVPANFTELENNVQEGPFYSVYSLSDQISRLTRQNTPIERIYGAPKYLYRGKYHSTPFRGGNRNPKQLLHSKKSNNIFRRKKSIKIRKPRKSRKYKKT